MLLLRLIIGHTKFPPLFKKLSIARFPKPLLTIRDQLATQENFFGILHRTSKIESIVI